MSAWSRLLRRLYPGYARVHATVQPYARAWDEANQAALSGDQSLWVVLGDSTAQGIGAPAPDQGYVGQVRRELEARTARPWRVLNLSRSGARAADVLAVQVPRLDELAAPPDLVTCAVGANDLVRRTRVSRLERRLAAIMDALPPGAVMATLPRGLAARRARQVNSFIEAEARRRSLLVADVWGRTGPPWRGKFAGDGFHPNATGYADWAAAFLDVIPVAHT